MTLSSVTFIIFMHDEVAFVYPVDQLLQGYRDYRSQSVSLISFAWTRTLLYVVGQRS